jgi:hypothetical protein
MDISGHILRRGVSTYLGQPRDDNNPPEGIVYQIPTWVMVMVATTVFGFLFVMTMIDYTFGRLVPTLVMIESPDALFEPLPTIDPDSDEAINPNAALEAQPVAVKQAAITSSFRKTLKHLQAKGGLPSRFRGFSIFLVNSILFSIISSSLSAIPLVPSTVAAVLASVLLANFSMAWTHIVISDPNPKPWFRRLPSMRLYKKIVTPAAILAVAEQLSVLLPATLAKVYDFGKLKETAPTMSGGRTVVVGLEGFSIFIFGLVLAFFFVLPANVVLTRVQASLLDDAEESIVPFDRSFGGKVVPEIVGGTGIIGMVDAWKTFDWASRIRLVKSYAKVLLMQIGVIILFVIVVVIEVFAIAHLDLKKILPGDGNNGGDSEI